MMSASEVPGVHVHVSHIQCLHLSHQVFLLLKRKEGWITFFPEISGLGRLITKTYLIEITSENRAISLNHRISENKLLTRIRILKRNSESRQNQGRDSDTLL
jgi:hypothetical protein